MEKWKTFGFDMARANADIHRRTGKWGKLKTPEEVSDYMKEMEERPIEQTPITPDRAIATPPKPRLHGLKAARAITLKNGQATLYKANEYGIPTDLIEVRPVQSNAEGRAYLCADCNARFASWDDFLKHALENKQIPA